MRTEPRQLEWLTWDRQTGANHITGPIKKVFSQRLISMGNHSSDDEFYCLFWKFAFHGCGITASLPPKHNQNVDGNSEFWPELVDVKWRSSSFAFLIILIMSRPTAIDYIKLLTQFLEIISRSSYCTQVTIGAELWIRGWAVWTVTLLSDVVGSNPGCGLLMGSQRVRNWWSHLPGYLLTKKSLSYRDA